MFRIISGESNYLTDRTEKLQELINEYNPDDVFNCDETGLLYRASPDRSSSLRTDMAQKAQKTGLPYSLPAASQEITETNCHWGVTKNVVFKYL